MAYRFWLLWCAWQQLNATNSLPGEARNKLVSFCISRQSIVLKLVIGWQWQHQGDQLQYMDIYIVFVIGAIYHIASHDRFILYYVYCAFPSKLFSTSSWLNDSKSCCIYVAYVLQTINICMHIHTHQHIQRGTLFITMIIFSGGLGYGDRLTQGLWSIRFVNGLTIVVQMNLQNKMITLDSSLINPPWFDNLREVTI